MKRLLLFLLIGATSAGFAQKSNVSSAGIAFKNYMSEKMTDMESAAKELVDAKGFIDQAYTHDETKDDPKMLMYHGMIYIEIAFAAQASGNVTLLQVDLGNALESGFASLARSKEVDTKERYHEDINNYCNTYYSMYRNMGSSMYGEEKYAEAMMMLLGAAQFGEPMGIVDSIAYFYGAMAAYQLDSMDIAAEGFKKCAEIKFQTPSAVYYWSQALQKQGKMEEAEKMLTEQVAANPNSKDIMIELINLYIDRDQKEKAVKVLTDAIALDPNNAVLIYTSGTIYENMDRFEDAEAAYTKVLELDPKNVDASFAMGGLYFNKGADLNNEANKLEFGDPKYDPMVAESKDYFNRAIPFLESAHENAPEDVVIMTSLKDAYGKAGQKEKFLEMKAKIEAAQGK